MHGFLCGSAFEGFLKNAGINSLLHSYVELGAFVRIGNIPDFGFWFAVKLFGNLGWRMYLMDSLSRASRTLHSRGNRSSSGASGPNILDRKSLSPQISVNFFPAILHLPQSSLLLPAPRYPRIRRRICLVWQLATETCLQGAPAPDPGLIDRFKNG